jgi:membrane-associated phospholipid phosphatase
MQRSKLLKNSLFILSISLLAKAILKCRKPAVEEGIRVIKFDIQSIALGILKAYRSPKTWKNKDFLTFFIIMGGILIMLKYDESISRWFRRKGETALPVLKEFGWYYGSPENHYIINIGFYLYGLFSNKEEIRKAGVLLISASLAAGILQTISKVLIGRARPLRNEGKLSFRPFSRENFYYSFPSGHSILSFTTAYAIGKQFLHPLPKTGIYAFGLIAPISRLWAGAHWITDAATSICLSMPIANSIDKYLIEERYYSTGLDK